METRETGENKTAIQPVDQNLGAANQGTTINNIPYELLDFILSHLDESNRGETANVSKLWNERTIKLANEQENAKAGEGIQTLIDKIDAKSYPDVVNNLNLLINENPICHSTSLLQLKENLDEVKSAVAQKLSKLPNEDLNKLKRDILESNLPQFLKNVGHIASTIKITEPHTKDNISRPDAALISSQLLGLAMQDEIKEAIKLAEILPDGEKALTFVSISKFIDRQGKTERAEKLQNEGLNLIKQ